MTVTKLTRKIEGHGHKLYKKDMATNYTRTVYFLPLNYLMTWQRNRFTVVALSDQTGEHATRPSNEVSKTEKGRHSRKNQG